MKDDVNHKSKKIHNFKVLGSILGAFLFFNPHTSFAFGKKRTLENPCPQIVILHAQELAFTETENRLLCGDKDPNGSAWSDIPLTQAKSNFKNFLQDRGYFFPSYAVLQNKVVQFNPGTQTLIKSIEAKNLPPSFNIHRYRTPLKLPLTPKRISEVRDWVRKKLMENGFACAKIEVTANPETGEILAEWLNPSDTSTIESIIEDDSIGLQNGIIRRYDAFHIDQTFSAIRTDITGKRSGSDKLTTYHNFEPVCDGPSLLKVGLKETTQVGLPRFVAASIGADTENLIVSRASWSHTRLGSSGSNIEFSASGSLKEQSLKTQLDWYFLNHESKQNIAPMIQLTHENETHYQLVGLKTHALWQSSFELENSHINFGVGPGWRNTRQLGGVGPSHSKYATIQTQIIHRSHLFEYHSQSPRSGKQILFTSTYAPTEIYGVTNPVQFKLESTWLYNPFDYEPPLVVFGLRTKAFYTHLPAGTSFSDVPIEYRQWLGGGRDIRGFGRSELPNNDYGSRLGFFAGSEIRVPGILPYKLEPFILADVAWLWTGPNTLSESMKIYWNPGFGMRWESPVGAIRLNVAHGYVPKNEDPNLSHWQFYLSLGEEF